MSQQPLAVCLAEALKTRSAAGVDLNQLVRETGAWAVGLWKKVDETLVLCVFGVAEGFDPVVAAEFEAATQSVPLDQTQLGIVNAAVFGRPALARAEELSGDLRKSAGWLGRFGARCSLSCPVNSPAGELLGVIAVSWAESWQQEDSVPQRLLSLADQIGRD
ncbi:MAG: hypothetical protein KDA78_06340 [Planctomycetaceae bacterium]|nr:hypothetical protein [Planctomycetaceae bacterium]